ncbi:hypothetical protein DPMN_064331 [Dreissena polymorpha]|uniref:Uncharacterized protein n=1 Tax=Dreissena polymorpha TaxID=45954 RepID=A0A9D4CDE6_DREPO|nr:hypothetical protein DPMN_064331 [Dreissena polymorpha]
MLLGPRWHSLVPVQRRSSKQHYGLKRSAPINTRRAELLLPGALSGAFNEIYATLDGKQAASRCGDFFWLACRQN